MPLPAEAFPPELTALERAILDAYRGNVYKAATLASKQTGVRHADAFRVARDLKKRGLLPDLRPAAAVPLGRLSRGSLRTRTINVRRLSVSDRRWFDEDSAYPEGVDRPRTRGDCVGGPRPCPFVSCAMHLFLDVSPRNAITVNHPKVLSEMDLGALPETCALDVADRGGTRDLSELASILGRSYDRAFQLVELALRRARVVAVAMGLDMEPSRADSRPPAPHHVGDPDLRDLSAAAHASSPTFRKAPVRQVSRTEAAQLFPGKALSPEYGEPRPSAENEAAGEHPWLRANRRSGSW